MERRITCVLLIEDEPVDAALVRRSLGAQAGARTRLEEVRTLQEGIDRLAKGDIDAVLLDLNLPDSAGIDTLVRLREHDQAIPIVVFTVAGDAETAVAALTAGAQDYLVKEEIGGSLLSRSIRYAIERCRIEEEKQRLRDRLLQAEKMDSLGALCAGLGFGFNTLIGTILDRCDHAMAWLESPRDRSELRSCLLEIHRATFRAGEMVQRVRDYAERERAPSADVDLPRFVLETSDFLEAIVPPEIEVDCDVSIEPFRVEIARPELQRLLVSLVVNAAEAIGKRRGSIAISTGIVQADEALLAGSRGWPDPRPGIYAFLRVADSGRGLAARHDRIFDPFVTTKLAGRGLGLAGVVGILYRHRGVIRADANLPSGAVFTALFPQPVLRSRA